MTERCDKCGEELTVGSWPFCGDHGKPTKSKGFEPYYDYGLGQEITGVGDFNKACRPKWEDDHIVHLQPRDKSPEYWRDLKDRRDARRAGR